MRAGWTAPLLKVFVSTIRRTVWRSMTLSSLWRLLRVATTSSWSERDQVLAALLERATEDALAKRVALQVVLPGVKSLIDGVRGWDVDERAARVVPTSVRRDRASPKPPKGWEPRSRALWTRHITTRHRTNRWVAFHRSQLRPGQCRGHSPVRTLGAKPRINPK